MNNPDQPPQPDPAAKDRAEEDKLKAAIEKARALKKSGEPTPPVSGAEKGGAEEIDRLREQITQNEEKLKLAPEGRVPGDARNRKRKELIQRIEGLRQKLDEIKAGGVVLPVDQRAVSTKIDTPAMIDTQTMPTTGEVFGGGEMGDLDEFNKESIRLEKERVQIPVAQIVPPLSRAEIFEKKKNELQQIIARGEMLEGFGDKGLGPELVEKMEEVFAEIGELTGEDLKRRVQVEAKKMLGGKEMNQVDFKKRETPKIIKEIKKEQEVKAKEFCRKEHGFAPDDPDFDLYFQKKLQASGLDPDEFYGMVCRGVRVDRLKEKVAFWKTVKNLVTGNESIAHKYEIPRDGKETLYLSEDDLEAFLAVQKDEQGREDELQKEKKFVEHLQKGRAKLAETRAKVAQEILDKAEVKYYVNDKEEHPLLARRLDYAEQRIVLPTSEAEEKKVVAPPVSKKVKPQELVPKKVEEEIVLPAPKKKTAAPPAPEKPKVEEIRAIDEFDPEYELENIKKLPKEEKKQALTYYKKQLIAQQEALADCRVVLIHKINENPNVEKGELMDLIEGFSQMGNFTENQKSVMKRGIESYMERHKDVAYLMEEYKNNKGGLIAFLTNKELGELNISEEDLENIEISASPMAVIIKTNAAITDKLHTRGAIEGRTPGGLFAESPDGVYYIVVNNQAGNESYVEQIEQHELQHAENDLVSEALEESELKFSISAWEEEKDPEKKKHKLEVILRAHQQGALRRVKNELIASLHNVGLERLKSENFFYKQEKTFIQKIIDRVLVGKDSIQYEYLKEFKKSEIYKVDPALSEKILGKEYGKIIEKAMVAFSNIWGHYSMEDSIALLADKDLVFWPTTIRRILKEKNKK